MDLASTQLAPDPFVIAVEDHNDMAKTAGGMVDITPYKPVRDLSKYHV